MNFDKKRKRINEINPAAFREKLGNLVPEVIRVKLASGDIKSGTATVEIGKASGEICSILVKSEAGAIRTVSAFTVSSGTAAITAANVAAGDTVTMMFI